jgi:hypothetical protein
MLDQKLYNLCPLTENIEVIKTDGMNLYKVWGEEWLEDFLSLCNSGTCETTLPVCDDITAMHYII